MKSVWLKRITSGVVLGGLGMAPAISLGAQQGDEPQEAKEISVVLKAQLGESEGEAGDEKVFEVVEQIAGFEAPKYYVGIMLKNIEGDLADYLGTEKGILVEGVTDDGPAKKAGIKKGDILLKADDEQLVGPDSLVELLRGIAEDEKPSPIKLAVLRAGKKMEIKLTPAERPAQKIAVFKANDSEANTFSFSFSSDEEDMKAIMEKVEAATKGSAEVAKAMNIIRLGSPAALSWTPKDKAADKTDGSATMEYRIEVKKDIDEEDMQISVTRVNDEPAVIVVVRGDDEKTFKESELEEMPKELRVKVVPLLKESGAKFKTLRVEDAALELSENLKDADGLQEIIVRGLKAAKEGENSVQVEVVQKEIMERAKLMTEQAMQKAREGAKRIEEEARGMAEMKAQIAKLEAELSKLREELKKDK